MRNVYDNPLITRYATKKMAELFSDDTKFQLWRKLWVVLAESEHEMGLPVTREQVEELRNHIDDINYDVAEAREKEVRHDVMSHVYAYGVQCPNAKGIIHLGATSCYVGDNTDILVMSDALELIESRVACVALKLVDFAVQYKDMPTLGFTHLQPAQLTTVGKRAALWLQDLMLDLEELSDVRRALKLRGVKGTTGTQASFLALFDGNEEKVLELEKRVCEKLGLDSFPLTGQTYSRKLDSRILNVLSSIAQSAYKFSGDLRILQNMKELEEPFEKDQIGSSAMAYKRNPMRSERIAALARYVLTLSLNPAITASTQWMERTLDDSANRRLALPQAFLAVDGILNIYANITSGIVVYPNVIKKHVSEELPFMATENIMLAAVKKGADRQDMHERIRQHSMQAGARVKNGESNDLLSRIQNDPAFLLSGTEIQELMNPQSFTGMASRQVSDYVSDILPKLSFYKKAILDEVKV